MPPDPPLEYDVTVAASFSTHNAAIAVTGRLPEQRLRERGVGIAGNAVHVKEQDRHHGKTPRRRRRQSPAEPTWEPP